jgi:ABC-type dipeptide/oligopeptide/nickel transport system permease component
MLSVLGSDFIRTARASGLSSTTVLVKYALRNALLPVVTTLGMVFGFMLGSSVVIEKVFGWPGVGSYAIDALTASDYAPIQGFVLSMGVLFVLLNLVIDLLYTLIDPRVSLEG